MLIANWVKMLYEHLTKPNVFVENPIFTVCLHANDKVRNYAFWSLDETEFQDGLMNRACDLTEKTIFHLAEAAPVYELSDGNDNVKLTWNPSKLIFNQTI